MLLECPLCRQAVELPPQVRAADCPACGGPLAARPPAVPPPGGADARARAEPHVVRGLAAARGGDYGRAVREFALVESHSVTW